MSAESFDGSHSPAASEYADTNNGSLYTSLYNPQSQGYSGEVIPTLHINRPANINDHTVFQGNSLTASVFDRSKDAVVRLHSERYVNGRKENIFASGFFVSHDGEIATDYHFVRGSSNFSAQTSDGNWHRVHVDQIDPADDLALLKIDNSSPDSNFPVLPLGRSDTSNMNNGLEIIGHPNGWARTFLSFGRYAGTGALCSMVGSIVGGMPGDENPNRPMIGLSMHIEGGDSGGPLLDNRGAVVGVADLFQQSQKSYATPVESLKAFLSQSGYVPTQSGWALAQSVYQLPQSLSTQVDWLRTPSQDLSGQQDNSPSSDDPVPLGHEAANLDRLVALLMPSELNLHFDASSFGNPAAMQNYYSLFQEVLRNST